MRVSSETEKREWMEKLKERATGSLANRRRPPPGEKVIKQCMDVSAHPYVDDSPIEKHVNHSGIFACRLL